MLSLRIILETSSLWNKCSNQLSYENLIPFKKIKENLWFAIICIDQLENEGKFEIFNYLYLYDHCESYSRPRLYETSVLTNWAMKTEYYLK